MYYYFTLDYTAKTTLELRVTMYPSGMASTLDTNFSKDHELKSLLQESLYLGLVVVVILLF